MRTKVSPTMIGAFVVGALVLAVVGVVVFSSGRMFKQTADFVLFFAGDVNGLNVGAAVKFKGVTIGSVSDVQLRFGDPKKVSAEDVSKGIRIPVHISIDQHRLVGPRTISDRSQLKELIDLGLRAQLRAESLVTGRLFVQLDFMPDKPATFVLPPGSKTLEIPTVSTAIEEVQMAAENLLRKLEDVQVDTVVKSVTDLTDNLNAVVASPELKETIRSLPTTVAHLDQAVASLHELSARLGAKSGPLLDSLKGTSEKGAAAMDQARATLQSVEQLVEPESPLSTQLYGSLQEVSEAARALRLLAMLLERNPSVLVRGSAVPNVQESTAAP